MLEKYVPGFDPDAFLQKIAAERAITKKEASEVCRREVPKEAYFQKKVKDGLKKQFPGAYVAKIAQGMYSQGGIPDVLCVVDGHAFFFEVKRPLFGKVSRLQEAAIEKIRAAGGAAEVVSWPEEAAGAINSWRGGDGQKETG